MGNTCGFKRCQSQQCQLQPGYTEIAVVAIAPEHFLNQVPLARFILLISHSWEDERTPRNIVVPGISASDDKYLKFDR